MINKGLTKTKHDDNIQTILGKQSFWVKIKKKKFKRHLHSNCLHFIVRGLMKPKFWPKSLLIHKCQKGRWVRRILWQAFFSVHQINAKHFVPPNSSFDLYGPFKVLIKLKKVIGNLWLKIRKAKNVIKCKNTTTIIQYFNELQISWLKMQWITINPNLCQLVQI